MYFIPWLCFGLCFDYVEAGLQPGLPVASPRFLRALRVSALDFSLILSPLRERLVWHHSISNFSGIFCSSSFLAVSASSSRTISLIPPMRLE